VRIKILLNYFNDFTSINAQFGVQQDDGKPAELEDSINTAKTVMSYKADLINFVNQ
jgi:hypothetical protein